MGKILNCYLMPHPPIVIPEIGGSEVENAKKTVNGMRSIAQKIESDKPEIIVIITPHGPVFQDAICISTEKELYGDFDNFNHGEIKINFNNDINLVNSIIKKVNEKEVFVGELDTAFAKSYGVNKDIDHGALVPLYYINKRYKDYKLIHLTIGMLSEEELYKVGTAINKAIEASQSSVSVIASGDLSHRLTKMAPAGYDAKGEEFDRELINKLQDEDVLSILNMNKNLIARAGECGYRPILILLGILDGLKFNTKIISYEGPFGVGYCNAMFDVLGKDRSRQYLKIIQDQKEKKIDELRNNESPYVKLARLTLEKYIKEGNENIDSDFIPREMTKKKAGVFVSIKKKGQLRGCIGTIEPTQKNVADEIINNAINAGTKDPRFSPVEEEELDELEYSVDILKEPEKINTIDELDVKKYGVIVQRGYKKGLLLPNLEGVDTPKQQVSIALQKAGISKNEDYNMERFEVVRYR